MKKLLFALGLSFLLAACGNDDPPPEPTQTKTETTASTAMPTANLTKVRVIASDYAPFVTRDELGNLIGFDVDILQEIAKHEGLELEIVPHAWSGALNTLAADQSDIVISAVTLNPERAEKYLASNPYINTPNSIAVLEDSPILSIDNLKGKVIGLEAGSSFLSERDKYAGTTFQEFDSSYLALKATTTKKVDGVVAHRLHLQYLLKDKNIQMRFIDLPTAYADKVIMLQKGNVELAQKINSGLDKIKADGTYDILYKKWFGEDIK